MITTIIISLIVGLAAGCFLNYAITFRTGQARNIGVCIAGALIGGAVIPALLALPGFWAGLIGSTVGVLILLWVYFKFTSSAQA